MKDLWRVVFVFVLFGAAAQLDRLQQYPVYRGTVVATGSPYGQLTVNGGLTIETPPVRPPKWFIIVEFRKQTYVLFVDSTAADSLRPGCPVEFVSTPSGAMRLKRR